MASLSDRIRYYWSEPRVQRALECLLANLSKVDISSALVNDDEAQSFSKNLLLGNPITPEQIILANIRSVLIGYDRAVKG